MKQSMHVAYVVVVLESVKQNCVNIVMQNASPHVLVVLLCDGDDDDVVAAKAV